MSEISFRYLNLINHYTTTMSIDKLIVELVTANNAAVWGKQLGITESEYKDIVAMALANVLKSKIENSAFDEIIDATNRVEGKMLHRLKHLSCIVEVKNEWQFESII